MQKIFFSHGFMVVLNKFIIVNIIGGNLSRMIIHFEFVRKSIQAK